MATVNVLVIGSGGREHAIIWKLSQSEHIKQIFAVPGSAAIQTIHKTTNVVISINNFQEITALCKSKNVSLVIVGPEDPLANGITDYLTNEGIKVFGPSKYAAQIESDKSWAKAFMNRHGIPTARWESFTDGAEACKFINSAPFPAWVVKASGLAAGKGVVVGSSKTEAWQAANDIIGSEKFGSAGKVAVVEELLTGEEVSVLAFCDGNSFKVMLPAQDHKRLRDSDTGPNTGGMGAYCPCSLISDDQLRDVDEQVFRRALDGFKKENIEYIGVLYAGLMLTADGIRVLEFNCRFGDPETEVILPLLESDLYEIMLSCCDHSLESQVLKWKTDFSAVGVVMASEGYPDSPIKGRNIEGIELINSKANQVLFHCGTTLNDDKFTTNGGRVLIVVSLASNLLLAATNATKSCEIIRFEGAHFRKDIAHKGLASAILKSGNLTYKHSGVDITAGNNLVDRIKPLAKSTNRSGIMGGLGGFGGLFDVKTAGYNDALLVSGTDGVGTKLKIAQEMGIHNTVGIDLVAMCANDILANGAQPLFFLDYFACGKLDVQTTEKVVIGIAEGCRQAGCALIGGETAEMPSMYAPGEYDLAGFVVGAVERSALLPRLNQIKENDLIIGLPSSGTHSNGFSLVRKVMQIAGVSYKDIAPFSRESKSFGEEFLRPTKIYVKSLVNVLKLGKIKAFAHITGGGLIENIPRILPDNFSAELDANLWEILPVFAWLATAGGINETEMQRTFNCGLGCVLIVASENISSVLSLVKSEGGVVVGSIVKSIKGPRVIVKNFTKAMDQSMRPFIPELFSKVYKPKKKVGVLISGSGTNLQSLINSTRDPTQHIGAEIVLVISNIADAYGLKRAEQADIATKWIHHKNYKSRQEFDMAMNQELEAAGVEILCLAGFMRILSQEFVEKWRGRLLNIHPSLLPSFKGTHAQRQALEAGVRVSGCTVHFVEPTIDSGAIIVQEAVPIEINDTEDILIERIKEAEHRAYPKALKLLATGKIQLNNDKTLLWL